MEWITSRLLLRQLGPEHAAAVRDYGLRCREFHEVWDPERPDDWWDLPVVAERLEFELAQAREDSGLSIYVSVASAPHRIIGRIALHNVIRGAMQGCTAGYGLAPEATGHGYMTEALNEAVRIAFEELWFHRVEVCVIPRNARSLAVAERCGFEREGFSPRFLRIAGRWEDHIRLARTNEAVE